MLKMKKISIWSEGKDLVVRGSEGPDDGSFEIKLVSAKQVLGPLIDGDLGGVSECMQHCAAQGHYSSAKMVIPSLPCAWGSISYFLSVLSCFRAISEPPELCLSIFQFVWNGSTYLTYPYLLLFVTP